MAGNLLEAGYSDSTFYRHSGHTTTIESSIGSPIERHRGIAWDGTNLYMVTDITSRAYRYSGWSSTVSSSFTTPSTEPRGCYVQDDGDFVCGNNATDVIYTLSGFTTTIKSSLAGPGSQVWGITFDGNNLITIDNGGDDIYLHSGWSTTITTSFASPSSSPADITWDGANIITSDYSADTIYIHSGKTSTISSSMAVQSTAGTGIADDDPSTAPTPVTSGGAVSVAALTVAGSEGPPAPPTPVTSGGTVTFSGLTVSGSGSTVTGTIYYVDQDTGNDSDDGLSAENAWKTLSKVSGRSFSPGDWIKLCRGCTWRETLTVPSSGNSSDQITIGAYGSGADPKIRGSNLVTGWSNYSGNIWRASLGTAPDAVFYNNARGAKQGSIISCIATGYWYWGAGYLYLYCTSDPDSAYTSPGVEATIRSNCVYMRDRSYVTVQDLNVGESEMQSIMGGGNGSGWRIDGCTVANSYHHGIGIHISAGNTCSNWTITGCTISYCGYQGIMVGAYSTCSTYTISDNTIHHCALDWQDIYTYTAGMKLWGDFDYITSGMISGNTVYSNGPSGGTSSASRGYGIWIDECGISNNLTRNVVYDNNSCGIGLESTSYQNVYYNIAYENGQGNQWTGGFDFRINEVTGVDCSYNEFYNNVSYNNVGCGFFCEGSENGTGPGRVDYNKVKNNIACGNDYRELYVRWGAQNSGYGTGNEYTYNCFGTQHASFIYWDGSYLSTYSAFDSAYGSDTHSIEGDPDFVDAGSYDFRLNVGSTCINAGVSVGLTVDFAGNQISGAPDVGAYEYGTQSSGGGATFPALEVSGAGVIVFKPPQTGADSEGAVGLPALEVSGGGPVTRRVHSTGAIGLTALQVAGGSPTTPRIDSGGVVSLSPLEAAGGSPTTPRVDGAGSITFSALAPQTGPEKWIIGGGSVTFPGIAADGGPPAIAIGGGSVTFPALAIRAHPVPPSGGTPGLVIFIRRRRRRRHFRILCQEKERWFEL